MKNLDCWFSLKTCQPWFTSLHGNNCLELPCNEDMSSFSDLLQSPPYLSLKQPTLLISITCLKVTPVQGYTTHPIAEETKIQTDEVTGLWL